MVKTQHFEAHKNAKRALTQKTTARMAIGTLAMLPALAFATAPWDSVADNVLAIFTGGLTRTIAIIAVIALGIAAMAGKLSWDWVIKIVIGIVFIFGGAAIVDYIIAAAS